MDASRWARIRAVFEAVLDASPETQAGLLEAECAGDGELRAQVEALLRAERAAGAADRPVAEGSPELIDALAAEHKARVDEVLRGRRLGAWKLLREIGEGGMGVVYLAERDDGHYAQQAAVKLVRSGWDAAAVIARFRAERQILASLNHPHIARLLDGGVAEDGTPYLVLEYVDGAPIHRHCDEHRLGLPARLALFLDVCGAIAHAHRSLVVHRDIKPNNILVDARGQVKLLDFGIAKLLDAGNGSHSMQRIFTPEYAAPEQVRGEPPTTGVDVYAAGLLLYELIAGQRPYGQTADTPAAYEHAILNEPSERPSRIAAALPEAQAALLAERRALRAGEWRRALRGDLDAIVLRALRKEPAHRYASIEALMDDVRRHLERRPVLARRGTWRYAAGRFLQRHALAASLAGVALLALLGGAGIAFWQATQARAARVDAEREARIAAATAEYMTRTFSFADPAAADTPAPSARDIVDRGLAQLDAEALDDATRVALLEAIAGAYAGLREADAAHAVLERAIALAAQGGDPLRQLRLEAAMASVLSQQGHLEAALARATTARQRLDALPAPAPELATRLDGVVGLVLVNLRRTAEAVPYLRRAFDAQLTAHGPSSEQVNVLTSVYIAALVGSGRQPEALAVTTALLDAARSDPRVSRVKLSNLLDAHGHALLAAGRFAEARASFREALAVDRELYGERHFRTGFALNNVAVATQRLQRYSEAATLFDELVAIRKEQLSADDVSIATALLASGLAYEAAGDDARALPRLREGLTTWSTGGTSLTRRYLRGALGLARVLERRGERSAARDVVLALQPFVDGPLQPHATDDRAELLALRDRLSQTR